MKPVIQKKLGQPERSATVQAVSCFTVDVVHQFYCISLSVCIQAFSFRNHITYVFMILFKHALLPRAVGVTVKNLCSDFTIFVTLQTGRELEFSSIVGENYLKQLLKGFYAKLFCQQIKYFNDMILGLFFQNKN
ncbi:MAG: hypothetical protein H6Q59_3368 [Firmicutes bacterium]|nr:hypothetical protein [Bacillota bacterium]